MNKNLAALVSGILGSGTLLGQIATTNLPVSITNRTNSPTVVDGLVFNGAQYHVLQNPLGENKSDTNMPANILGHWPFVLRNDTETTWVEYPNGKTALSGDLYIIQPVTNSVTKGLAHALVIQADNNGGMFNAVRDNVTTNRVWTSSRINKPRYELQVVRVGGEEYIMPGVDPKFQNDNQLPVYVFKYNDTRRELNPDGTITLRTEGYIGRPTRIDEETVAGARVAQENYLRSSHTNSTKVATPARKESMPVGRGEPK